MRPPASRAGLFAVVVAAAAVGWVLPLRQPNCNTAAHYALVQSIAHGAKSIDSIPGQSCDISWWHNHYYANKAPGLALATVPWYLLVRAAGLLAADPNAGSPYPRAMRSLPRRDLWLMGLWGAVLPALLLLVLVRHVADRLMPGTGTAAAAVLALATLLLPFGGLFFSHALSAFLGFAAFAVVLDRITLGRAAIAGLLVGAAVVVEYPNVLTAIALAAYLTVRRGGRRSLALAYFSGFAAGVTPLLIYDWWAFGSPFHLSYIGAVLVPGLSGHDLLGANSAGFFGVEAPSPARAIEILFSTRGLVFVAPVLALAPIGVAQLWRAGRRPEAALVGGIGLLFLVYNASYYSPLGGATPGPRFLIPALPFVVVAAACVFRKLPITTLALVIPSAAILLAAHVTQPLISAPYSPHDWWIWITRNSFTSTVLDPTAHAWPPAALIALALTAGLVAGGLSLGRPPKRDVLPAAAAATTWICALVLIPQVASVLS